MAIAALHHRQNKADRLKREAEELRREQDRAVTAVEELGREQRAAEVDSHALAGQLAVLEDGVRRAEEVKRKCAAQAEQWTKQVTRFVSSFHCSL